jgi:copper transport protein
VLTSLPPPPKALANIGSVDAHVGPGPIDETVKQGSYQLHLKIDPNRAALPNTFSATIDRNGQPLRGAEVTMRFTMLDMDAQQQTYTLPEKSPGTYTRAAPALVMVGHWGLGLTITPKGGTPVQLLVEDRANG